MRTETTFLDQVHKALSGRHRGLDTVESVPACWFAPHDGTGVREVSVLDALERAVISILRSKPQAPNAGQAVYNIFIRHFSALEGVHPTRTRGGDPYTPITRGTYLRTILLLPYLKDLGVTHLHILPVFEMSEVRVKGTVGSPYAITTPRRLDNTVVEAGLGLSAKVQYGALVEAAHRFGMKVIQEIPLRALAPDSDYLSDHPEWVYWIRRSKFTEFRKPSFTADQYARIATAIETGRLHDLPTAESVFRNLIQPTPDPSEVRLSTTGYSSGGEDPVVPAPAFSDWPFDDHNQPWTDITYLRLFTNPEFDYPAYNTLRYFTPQAVEDQWLNEGVLEYITTTLHHAQNVLGVDGVFIDMGHGFPQNYRQRMRKAAPNLELWYEDFNEPPLLITDDIHLGIPEKPGSEWFAKRAAELDAGSSYGMHRCLRALENHNSVRAFATMPDNQARGIWLAALMLPGIPWIHSGQEFKASIAINAVIGDGSGTTVTATPLFNDHALPWNDPANLRTVTRQALRTRARMASLYNDSATWRGRVFDEGSALAWHFIGENGYNHRIDVLVNPSGAAVRGRHPTKLDPVHLAAGQCVIFVHLGSQVWQLDSERIGEAFKEYVGLCR